MAAKSDNTKDSKSEAFAKHKTIQNNDTSSQTTNGTTKMSIFARILIFICVPSITGLSGLGVSYMLSLKTPQEGEDEQHIVDFDRDFVTPFLLALAFVVVLGFQTNGFNPQSAANRKGVFVWPSTRRKVRRERIVVDDDDNADKKEQ